MKASFRIAGRLPGMNELLGAFRRHHFAGAKLKREATGLCAEWAIAGGLPRFEKPVRITVDWHEPNNRRDPDNVQAGIKFILDGLIHANRLPNDGRKWVKSIIHNSHPADPKDPRVEVTLEEV